MRSVLILWLVTACSSSETEWDGVARQLAGELRAVRPTARAIAAAAHRDDPASVRAVVGMCASVDSALERIASTRARLHALDREPGGPHLYMEAVPNRARALREHRDEVCEGDDWRCRDWCVRTWAELADAVDVLRTHAATHGARLETLSW